jgi:hypothetical protein
MFCAFAFWMAVRSFAFISGSAPPSFTATVIAFASFGKILDILSQRASLDALLYSNALPMIFDFHGKNKQTQEIRKSIFLMKIN